MAITLNYWNGRGLMEIPRMLLAIAGKTAAAGDFTDYRSDGEVPGHKLSCNLG